MVFIEKISSSKFVNICKINVKIQVFSMLRRDVQISERTLEIIPEFTYIGSKVSSDSSMNELWTRTLILQPEIAVHLKEPIATDEAGTI